MITFVGERGRGEAMGGVLLVVWCSIGAARCGDGWDSISASEWPGKAFLLLTGILFVSF